MNQVNFINRRDMIIIIVLLTLAIAIGVVFHVKSNSELPPQAQIIFQDDIIKIIHLDDEPKTFSIDPLPQVEFTLEDGQIAFTSSNCPDQICVRTGWINQSNQFAACLPNEVLLLIQPAK